MKVDLLKPIGYCKGVSKALLLALETKKNNPNSKVYIYGSLVHNKHVIDYLSKEGLITLEQDIKNLDLLNKEDILILTAHGHSSSLEEELNKRGIRFIDATCDIVKENMNIIRTNLDRGIIYIGQRNHEETKASLSISDNIYLYDLKDGIDYSIVKSTHPLVVNQTTLSLLELESIHKDIINNIKGAKISDEICNATRLRQMGIKNVDKKYDLILVVGSSTSSNTEKLYQMALNNIHCDVYKIDSEKDLENINLNKYQYCLLASGTSTPLEIINKVKEKLI